MQIYNVYQSGKRLYIDEKEIPDNKIVVNKYDNMQQTLRLISDGTLPPRLYWALRNPKLSNKYFILPLINNEDLIVGTDISATPGLWDLILIGTPDDYIIEGTDIDQSKLTYISDTFRRLFVRDNYLEELDFEEQVSPTFKVFYDEIMFRLDGVVTDEDIQEMNDKIDDSLEFSKNASEKAEAALSLAKGATKAFVYDTYEDMITELNVLSTEELNLNYHVMIRTVCVPDLWISGVSDEHVEYTYTSNEDFIVDLTEDGVVQVGHFVLSALETQKVDLSDYVKNDDYAIKNGNHGIVKIDDSFGVGLPNGASNPIAVICATEKQVKDRTGTYKPINSSLIDLVVQEGLVNSKLEWTEEQKQLARALLGSVGSNDIATSSKLGLVQAHANYGVMANGNGLLVIASASKPEIDSKTNSFKPITAEKIDYAVKKALSDCKLEGDDVWTDEEKAKALELLGGIPKTQPTQRNYGDGVLIGFDTNGNLVYQNVFGSYVSAYSIPIRDADGILYGNEPTSEKGLANKKYVDAKNDWRYIGKVTTEEDVQSLFMSTDTDGKPFSLKKIRVVFKNMPNSGDFTGWTRVRINSNTWSSHTIGTGVKTSELYGVTDIEIEKIGEHLRVNTLLVSQNKTTAPNVMVNGTATTLAYTFDLTSFTENITNIELYSYQLAIGAGSYVEVWGIDA